MKFLVLSLLSLALLAPSVTAYSDVQDDIIGQFGIVSSNNAGASGVCGDGTYNTYAFASGKRYLVVGIIDRNPTTYNWRLQDTSGSNIYFQINKDAVITSPQGGTSDWEIISIANASSRTQFAVAFNTTSAFTARANCQNSGGGSFFVNFLTPGRSNPNGMFTPNITAITSSKLDTIGEQAFIQFTATLTSGVSAHHAAYILDLTDRALVSEVSTLESSNTWDTCTTTPSFPMWLNITPENTGGAYWIMVRETKGDTDFGMWSATARNESTYVRQISTTASVRDYGVRLWYEDIPYTSAQQNSSIQFDKSGIGTNTLQTCKITTKPSSMARLQTNNSQPVYAMLSTDDFPRKNLNITVVECMRLTTACATTERLNPLPSVYVLVNGNTTTSGVTNSLGYTNLSNFAYFGLIQIYPTLPGYTALPIALNTPDSDYNEVTIYMARTSVTIEPRGATFNTPNPAIHFINKTTPPIHYWSIFKVEPASGTPTLREGPSPLTNSKEITRYPQNGNTTATPGFFNHTGQYYIIATDINSTIIDQTSFVICASGSCPSQPPVANSALNFTFQQQIAQALVPVLAAEYQADHEEQTRNQILTAVDWANRGPMCREDNCISNMYLVLAFAIGTMIASIAIGRQGGKLN